MHSSLGLTMLLTMAQIIEEIAPAMPGHVALVDVPETREIRPFTRLMYWQEDLIRERWSLGVVFWDTYAGLYIAKGERTELVSDDPQPFEYCDPAYPQNLLDALHETILHICASDTTMHAL